MVFVADDLAGWLIGQMADAGRKKLVNAVLGSEQERALMRVATAAARVTAEEVISAGGEQAEHVARVINEVFQQPLPGSRLARQRTLLETLQAGVASQLKPLDDASLTGLGQSWAVLQGVPVSVLAERLAY